MSTTTKNEIVKALEAGIARKPKVLSEYTREMIKAKGIKARWDIQTSDDEVWLRLNVEGRDIVVSDVMRDLVTQEDVLKEFGLDEILKRSGLTALSYSRTAGSSTITGGRQSHPSMIPRRVKERMCYSKCWAIWSSTK